MDDHEQYRRSVSNPVSWHEWMKRNAEWKTTLETPRPTPTYYEKVFRWLVLLPLTIVLIIGGLWVFMALFRY